MLKDWDSFFLEVKSKPYAKSLHAFLEKEYATECIYPPRDMMFSAFRFTSPESLKCVILGQDPYHNSGEAMGLAFSVPVGISLPPSLVNIYREIEEDCGVKMNYKKGDLVCWARQGVLLLNAYLTVREGKPLSHKIEEYDLFSKDVITYLESLNQPIAYMLWGNFAKRYSCLIHSPKHKVFMAAHPSPLSANRGGWFHKHLFSQVNDFLIENGVSPIDWQNK